LIAKDNQYDEKSLISSIICYASSHQEAVGTIETQLQRSGNSSTINPENVILIRPYTVRD
jgi:hypothetical protein